MTEKRFTIVDEQFISYYGGTGHKISNEECGFWLWHSKTESQKVCDKLNSILDENEQLKKDCTVLIYHNQEYRKENEQLKADKQSLIDFIRKEFPKSYKHILEGFND